MADACAVSYDSKPTTDPQESTSRVVSFKDFGEQTTLHGLRYITNSNYPLCRRLTWLVLLVAVNVWLVVNIIKAGVILFQYPESSSISINHVSSINFPAVTICNINMFRSNALEPHTAKLLTQIFGGTDGLRSNYSFLHGIKLFPNSTQSNSIDILVDASHRLDEMLRVCRWKTKPCSHLNFTQRLTDQGTCYTFNEPPDEAGVLKVQYPGAKNGLYMQLNIQQDLYTHSETASAGIKVLLHPQGELPIMKEFAFSLSPGFEASVAVRQQVVKSLKAPYKSNCTDGVLQDFPFKYSAAACQFECKARYVMEKCGCRDFRWPVSSTPICNVEKQVSCVYYYEDEFISEGRRCDCPIACVTTAYDSRTSLAYWPASFRSHEIQKTSNWTEENIRKNFLGMYIYFEEIMYMGVEQTKAYTLENFQSDIGGYLGLLCGMSLLTIVEWADFVIFGLLKRCKSAVKA